MLERLSHMSFNAPFEIADIVTFIKPAAMPLAETLRLWDTILVQVGSRIRRLHCVSPFDGKKIDKYVKR